VTGRRRARRRRSRACRRSRRSGRGRDLERLGDVRVGVDDHELAVARAQALDGADEHAEGGRVEEGGLREVDDDADAPVLDGVGERLLQLGRGEQVDLAADGDDVTAFAERLLGQCELSWHDSDSIRFFRKGVGPVDGPLTSVEEVPGLDDVALGVLDVQRAVPSGMLLGAADRDARGRAAGSARASSDPGSTLNA
jgi:hypothetical protein